ncbi:hypothetical protein EIN_227380 [Entamoeba invadens IP1]|uniref:Uncharacterized protein n=1 Tax=Entamoeba invadens IP1 TaxID=370355 RepID=A0A0A1U619_ENTIV|nr:hypothetical protein EIN_227380 [Entamoeba invadens IP1]ELP88325.1 hypothetical protein EIN_227380 [Entamoeba invadens IP1]|eukprot:XP_004255096.1 hypothetical protein EIN_227380 [Entamoeba invadens IP1]
MQQLLLKKAELEKQIQMETIQYNTNFEVYTQLNNEIKESMGSGGNGYMEENDTELQQLIDEERQLRYQVFLKEFAGLQKKKYDMSNFILAPQVVPEQPTINVAPIVVEEVINAQPIFLVLPCLIASVVDTRKKDILKVCKCTKVGLRYESEKKVLTPQNVEDAIINTPRILCVVQTKCGNIFFFYVEENGDTNEVFVGSLVSPLVGINEVTLNSIGHAFSYRNELVFGEIVLSFDGKIRGNLDALSVSNEFTYLSLYKVFK